MAFDEDVYELRRQKLKQIEALGQTAYRSKYEFTHTIPQILAAAFAVVVFFWHGRTFALQFVTGYVIELSLSIDNLFVFLLIFRYFKVAGEHQHKVLLGGIVGALVMRGLFTNS